MLTRHLNELMSRLERAEVVGCAEIKKAELLLWYGRDRITRTLWADLYEKWQEVSPERMLLVGDSHADWVLVQGQGITISGESWLTDARDLAGLSTIASS